MHRVGLNIRRALHTSTHVPAARQAKGKFNWGTSSGLGASLDGEPQLDITRLTRLTADQLATYRKPPRGVTTLVRDFIHDALYNPFYGYFSQRAVIFSPPEPFNFREMRNTTEFDQNVAQVYAEISRAKGAATPTIGAQLWHTPVELFQPWYGQAIARCLASEYLLRYFPYEDLVIYEMGGGNGTLSLNILDYLRAEYPEVYERTTYRIIEISPALAQIQRKRLAHHSGAVEIINQSIFEWQEVVQSPCFFLALEVIDNFAHDVVRYDTNSFKGYQGITVTNPSGEYEEVYEPISDPLIQRYLDYRDAAGHTAAAMSNRLMHHPLVRRVRHHLPFTPNLTKPEFIPTRLVTFLEVLRDKFPKHRLLLSDFSSLPDSMEGAYNAPVVQTRYRGTMVPCSTYMVQPGYFDIFFPTNFELLCDMYHIVMSSSHSAPLHSEAASRLEPNFFSSRTPSLDKHFNLGTLDSPNRRARIYSHKDFLLKYGDLAGTELRSGENPILDYYTNVKVMF